MEEVGSIDPPLELRPRLRRHTTGAMTLGETSDVCTETDDIDNDLLATDTKESLWHYSGVLLAGGLSGSIGKTVTAPLSRLTILFQVHSLVSTQHTGKYSNSIFSAFHKVWKNEGFFALWKGNGASVLHRFPYSAVNFFVFELTKSTIVRQNFAMFPEDSDQTRFISGALAGAVATTACYPIDLIRTRLATQDNINIRYHGIRHAVFRIQAEEGFRGLYRGLGAALSVSVPNLAINFTLYGKFKNTFRQYRYGENENDLDMEEQLSVYETLICGGASGIVSSLVTFPIDVIRRQMQVSALHVNANGLPSTPKGIAKEIFSKHGIYGFYRGLTPELLKVIPMVGITFGAFERFKAILVPDDDE